MKHLNESPTPQTTATPMHDHRQQHLRVTRFSPIASFTIHEIHSVPCVCRRIYAYIIILVHPAHVEVYRICAQVYLLRLFIDQLNPFLVAVRWMLTAEVCDYLLSRFGVTATKQFARVFLTKFSLSICASQIDLFRLPIFLYLYEREI